MNLKQLIQRQKQVHNDRYKRAKIVLKTVGNIGTLKVNNASVKGYEHLLDMTKDQIIEKYIDGLDVVMLGLFGEDNNKQE